MSDSLKRNRFSISLASFLLLLICIPAISNAKSNNRERPSHGERLYMANCEACHMLGTNVIKPEKELVKSEKIASRKIFKEYLSEKHGVMPAFQDIANDSVSLKDLYGFVRKLKIASWEYQMKNDPPSGELEPKAPNPPHNAN